MSFPPLLLTLRCYGTGLLTLCCYGTGLSTLLGYGTGLTLSCYGTGLLILRGCETCLLTPCGSRSGLFTPRGCGTGLFTQRGCGIGFLTMLLWNWYSGLSPYYVFQGESDGCYLVTLFCKIVRVVPLRRLVSRTRRCLIDILSNQAEVQLPLFSRKAVKSKAEKYTKDKNWQEDGIWCSEYNPTTVNELNAACTTILYTLSQ